MSDFAEATAPEDQSSDFATLPLDNAESPVSAAPNPLTAQLTAAAQVQHLSEINQMTLDAANQQLADGKEGMVRLNTAAQRQQKQMQAVANRSKGLIGSLAPDSATKADFDQTYNNIAASNLEEASKTSIERQAIETIHDDLAAGNTVEAKLTNDLIFGRGSATKQWYDTATKNLLLAQKMSQFENESKNQSWGDYATNVLDSFLPTNYNFARAGVVPNAGAGLLDWFLPGRNLEKQSAKFQENMMNSTPEAFADALKDGGELDQSLRSNATTGGVYDPTLAKELLGNLSYINESDATWANVWGAVDVGSVLPWSKLTSIPKTLVNLGSRTAANRLAANAFEDVIANGAAGAAKRTGVAAPEVAEHLELSAMTPSASTPHSVPLSVDLSSRIEAAQKFKEMLPNKMQVNAMTNPSEYQAAAEAAIKEIEKTTGRSVKDVQHFYEDLGTGEKVAYKPGAPLPEQGNSVHFVEVTFGKKSGGGFASAKTAMSELRNRMGLTGDVVHETTTTERTVSAADQGFTETAFHGTASDFKEFDHNFAGSATKAENTRGGVTFLSDDPEVAHGYARVAAQTKNQVTHDTARAAFHANPSDANADAFEHALDGLANDAGANVRPTNVNTSNFVEHDMKGRAYNGPETQAILDHARAQGKDGVVFRNYEDDLLGGKVSTIYAVFNEKAMQSSLAGPKIVRDTSGQWFAKARFNVNLEGFITSPLNTPNNGLLSFAKSSANRLDRDAHYKAVAAGSSANALQGEVAKLIKSALKGLNSGERQHLDGIIRKGQNMSKWLDDTQFDMVYERLAGELPSPAVKQAYATYQEINDLEFFLRRNEIYKSKAQKGIENVKFALGKTGINFDGEGVVKAGSRPTTRVFDATNGIHYNAANPLTSEKFDRMIGEGYVHVRTSEAVSFPNGQKLTDVLVHRSDLERTALSVEKQLFYKEGGHRAYTGRNFVKQSVRGKQPDTGTEYLENPNVFRTSNNPNKLRAWAETFNRAIDDAASGITDPQHFDDNVFANGRGLSFPSGEEFLKAVEDGKVSLKDHVEVVGDRELPRAYEDTARFEHYTTEESSEGGYYRTTGRMYTSSKGEALLDESGEFAETVDPWETTNRALENLSRLTSFSNYKENVMQRFKATFGQFMEGTVNDSAASLIKAPIRAGTDLDLAKRIRAEQQGVDHILNFETDWEKNVRHQTNKLANWVLGDAEGGARLKGHDFVYWLQKNNPVNYIRGLAFDAKLGFFNIGQLFLQSSTMLASAALSPAHGMKGMLSSAPLIAFVQAKGSEAVLDTLAKNGAWKIGGFTTEQEFKDYARLVHRSGFLDVGSSQLSINDLRPNRVFGATSKIDAVRESGRTFFYLAEKLNRSVSTRIAYEELKAKGVQLGSAEFREKFVGLADDYSFNMTHESSATFQRGLASIPTQFWGYNVRMMEAMFGPRFTAQQKVRLIASQTALWGVAGVPIAETINEYVKNSGDGAPIPTGSVESLLDRGLVDNAIAAVTGADVRIGERIGTGTFLTNLVNDSGAFAPANAGIETLTGGLVKDFFSGPKYGKSPTAIEFFGGASASIGASGIKAATNTLADFWRYSTAEKGDANLPLLKDDFVKFADNVSTISNFHKAYLVNKYGYFRSAAGSIQAEVPTQDAFAIAMGLGTPQEMDNAASMKMFLDNKQKVVSEAATLMRNWRQEAIMNPDLREENARKAQLYANLLPPEIVNQVIKQVNNTTDSTYYEHIATKYNKEKMNGESVDAAQ